tara:strand:- start:395 stop:940 length:546 start_codon:yes stop_codon:yes gene_type:complete
MYKEPKVYSSYRENNIGQTLYDIVIKLKPQKIVEIGVLEGYSTICMAQALKNLGEGGKVYAYDLFEEYKYRNFSKTEVWNNVNKYEVQDHVQLKRKSFDRWLNTSEDFDLLHLDISNDGDIVLKMHDKYPNHKVIFEGGSTERDNVDWMVKYKKTKIETIRKKCKYKIINNNFPSLSGYNL